MQKTTRFMLRTSRSWVSEVTTTLRTHCKNLLAFRPLANRKIRYKELSRFGDIERVHVSGSEVWANVTFADDRDAR